jgi:hypothetical protein
LAFNTGEASQEPEIALDEAASRRALDAIRRDAVEGLLALPRVGMGVGGFLTGIRRANRIQILDRIEIPCLHARGPAFLLTSEELENARTLASTAEPLEVLGMYVSKTRGALEPGPADLETLDALCPGAEQILLVVRPSTVEPVRATLFTCAPGARVNGRLEVPMDGAHADDRPLEREEAPEPPSAPAPPSNLALQAVKLTAVDSEQTASDANIAAAANEPLPEPVPVALPRVAKAPEVNPGSAPRRSMATVRQHRARQDRRSAVLYTCGALALIAAATVAALDILSPAPELTLNVREENGVLVFRWNRKAAAGANRGRLLVNDAGQLREFPLDAARIEVGFFQYRRKSDQIVAKLVLGDRAARAVFFGNSRAPGASRSASPPDSGNDDSGKPGEQRTN